MTVRSALQTVVKPAYMSADGLQLVWPAEAYLLSYTDALRQGWSPDNLRPQVARDELQRIETDPRLFLAQQVDRDAQGPPIILPDGSQVPRLPGYVRWIWDGEICGSIGLRWQPGSSELPPHCLGHIGYSIVPWKRQKGYATRALRLLLAEIDEDGLDYVELTTDVSNEASKRVIEANGGLLVERFNKPAVYGGAESLRYRIVLQRGGITKAERQALCI